MRKILVLLCIFILPSCTIKSKGANKMLKNNDNLFTKQNFKTIRSYILKNGDRTTYCNMFNNNPHFEVGNFDVFLNPINQFGSRGNCDCPENDFTELVIWFTGSRGSQYYHIKLSAESNVLDLESDDNNKSRNQLEKEIEPYFESIFKYMEQN